MDAFEFGRYRAVAELGKGATGAVYLAESGAERVALKILHRNLACDPVILRRFRHEAALARELRHPGIARVYDLVEHEGREALSMEYCPGGNLSSAAAAFKARPDSGPGLSADTALDWIRQLSEALGYAHARGWVHRAVKPENVLVGADGRLRLSDFGSARLENLSGLTTSTTYLATPLYIAPEVMRGDHCRPSHDFYSLGAVFYSLLAGKPHREGGLSALLANEGACYVPLAEIRPDLPSRLTSLIDALLSPPRDRPGSAGDVFDYIDGKARAAGEAVKRCLFCDGAMPADSPFCLDCGEPDLYPAEYRGDDAEALVLTKLAEEAETMDRLYRFLGAWSGDDAKNHRFVTEDKRLYGKEELKSYRQLPYPLINWLEPSIARSIIATLEIRGFGALHLERRSAYKIQRKSDKKPPLLSAARPAAFRPIGRDILTMQYGEKTAHPASTIATIAPTASSAPTASPGPDRAYGPDALRSIVFDCQRIADMLAGYKDDAPALLRRLVVRCAGMADELERGAAALDAVSLPGLYLEETRLGLELIDEATMPTADWNDAKRRLERNVAAWRRYEALESSYARTAFGLEELRRGLASLAREMGDAMARRDAVAQSRALAAFEELTAFE